jgi:hypothetical protein
MEEEEQEEEEEVEGEGEGEEDEDEEDEEEEEEEEEEKEEKEEEEEEEEEEGGGGGGAPISFTGIAPDAPDAPPYQIRQQPLVREVEVCLHRGVDLCLLAERKRDLLRLEPGLCNNDFGVGGGGVVDLARLLIGRQQQRARLRGLLRLGPYTEDAGIALGIIGKKGSRHSRNLGIFEGISGIFGRFLRFLNIFWVHAERSWHVSALYLRVCRI